MHRLDLTTYRAVDLDEPANELVAVGWLYRTVEFPTGERDRALIDRIKRLCVLERVAVTRGFHQCNIGDCVNRPLYPPLKAEIDGQRAILGSSEIRVPVLGRKRIFGAPNLLVHYIEEHGYMPPQEFSDAVRLMDI